MKPNVELGTQRPATQAEGNTFQQPGNEENREQDGTNHSEMTDVSFVISGHNNSITPAISTEKN